MDAEPSQAELVLVRSELVAGSKSTLVVVHNRTPQELQLVSSHLLGKWVRPPPRTIPAFAAVVVASVSNQLLRGTEWDVLYTDVGRTPYHFAALNAYTATAATFTASILGSRGAEPAELRTCQTEAGTAAEADLLVQRTVARLRIRERTSVTQGRALDSPFMRVFMPGHIAEVLEVCAVDGNHRVRTKDGWFSLKATSDLQELADPTAVAAGGGDLARRIASPFALVSESELSTTAAAVLCSTPNTALHIDGVAETSRCLLGDCVLTASHLLLRPFATDAHGLQLSGLVFSLPLAKLIEARAAGGGLLGLGLLEELSVELLTAVSVGSCRSDSLKFEARWEREDLLQALQRQLFLIGSAPPLPGRSVAADALPSTASAMPLREGVSPLSTQPDSEAKGASETWVDLQVEPEPEPEPEPKLEPATPFPPATDARDLSLNRLSRSMSEPSETISTYRVAIGSTVAYRRSPKMADRASTKAEPGAWIEVSGRALTKEGEFVQDGCNDLWLPVRFLIPAPAGSPGSLRGPIVAVQEKAVAALRLRLGGTELDVSVTRQACLEELREKIVDSLLVTIELPSGKAIALTGTEAIAGDAESLWTSATSSSDGNLDCTLSLTLDAAAVAASPAVESHEPEPPAEPAAEAAQGHTRAAKVAELSRKIKETVSTVELLSTMEGTETMIASTRLEIAQLEADLAASQQKEGDALQLAEGEPPSMEVAVSRQSSAVVVSLAERLHQSEVEIEMLSRQLTAGDWDEPLALPAFLDGQTKLGISPQMLSRLWAALPPSVHNHEWSLVYRLGDHGASLATLYSKLAERRDIEETVLLVRDTRGYAFGCLAMRRWAAAPSHYGMGECMVFKLGPTSTLGSSSPSPPSRRGGPLFQRFGWTRNNSMFQLATKDSLSMGGGGAGYALWLDANLEQGTSMPSETFANSCLASSSQFQISNVELWGLCL